MTLTRRLSRPSSIEAARKEPGRRRGVPHLLDSDWVIDALAGNRSAVEPIYRHADSGIFISIITSGEVSEGAFHFPDAQAHLDIFRQFLSAFTVLGLTDPVMEVFAQNCAALRRQGNLIPDFDLLIGATALHHDLVLMTRNVRHFSRLPNLRLYQPT